MPLLLTVKVGKDSFSFPNVLICWKPPCSPSPSLQPPSARCFWVTPVYDDAFQKIQGEALCSPCYLAMSCTQLKRGIQTLLGTRNLNFAGLRKRFAFRYSWHRQQGSRQDSAPGMTKSGLELTLATLEGLPSTAGRSLLECKVTGNPQGSAHQRHENFTWAPRWSFIQFPSCSETESNSTGVCPNWLPAHVLQGCCGLWSWQPHCHLLAWAGSMHLHLFLGMDPWVSLWGSVRWQISA